MYLRIDKLQFELPMPEQPAPEAANAVQDLLGGRFGEMSTLMNYTYQSFNFRGRTKVKPYYDLIANIATEELGHIEMVAATINNMLTGAPKEGTNDGKIDPTDTPLSSVLGVGNPHHFGNNGGSALVSNALGQPWQGDFVFNSGDLVLDLLHNFFLESGARMGKIRVYEMTDHPTARAMLGYLLVRGGVHQVAYAKALEELTGANVTKMLNIPKIENDKFPETKVHRDANSHRTLYRFSPDDFKDIDKIWKGVHPDDGQEVFVKDGPPEGGQTVDHPEETAAYAPGYDPGELAEIAQRMMRNS
ncbi:MAG: manganese catalase family protein [Rubrobacter sp.]|jgi:Mn-containing catalase|nr:manganese catalase family protein [Rubrobacter sp.]